MLIPTEIQLLLAAAHINSQTATEMCAAQLRLARTISSPDGEGTIIDWSLFHELAVQHNLAPLIYQRLRPLPIGLVPASALTRLKETALTLALRNERLAERLVQVSDLLAAKGIPAIPFKGATLAIQAYGDLSLRQFMDIDLLVHPQDFAEVYRLLLDAGWQPEIPILPHQMNWHLRGQYHLRFLKNGDPLEIHWAVSEHSNQHPLKADDFWKNLRTVRLLQQDIQIFSPENNLLAVLIHGTSNQWQKLKWVADLAYLGRSLTDLEWERMLQHASQFGFRRALLVGCDLANRLIGLALAAPIQAALHEDRNASQLAWAAQSNAFSPHPKVDPITNNRFFLKCRERFGDRLYYFLDQAFIPKQIDWQAFALPPRLYPAYYLLRPARLAFKFGPGRVNRRHNQ